MDGTNVAQSEPRSQARGRRAGRLFVIGSLGLIAAFIALEGLTRLLLHLRYEGVISERHRAAPGYVWHDFHGLGAQMMPFMIYRPTPNYKSRSIQTNSQGYRTHEFGPKPDDVFRILWLGGSAAFGVGATSNETTIPGYLETTFIDAVHYTELGNRIAAEWVLEKIGPSLPVRSDNR